MEVILIYDNNDGFLGVAADYRSAILELVKYKWLNEDLKVWNEIKYRWVPITELLGDDWLAETLVLTVDEFNDFYEGQFYLKVEDIISYSDEMTDDEYHFRSAGL